MNRRLPAALLLLSVLAGCAAFEPKNPSPAEPPVSSGATATVRILAYNSESVRTTYLAYLRKQFPDVTIVFDYVPLEYYSGTLNAQVLSDSGPDLIEVGGETRLLAGSGMLLDLTGQPFIGRYTPKSLIPYSVQGHVYATPLQSWFEGIFYNKKLFSRYGLAPPETFDEFIALHKKLAARGVKPQIMGAQSWEPMMKQSIALVNSEFYSRPESEGFDAAFDEGKARLADGWLPAVTEWSRLIREGCLTPDMLGYSYEQALAEFAEEGAAMWESGPWSADAILQRNPEINLGMFPVPGRRKGGGWLVGGPGSALAVNKNSRNVAAALRILSATASPEAQRALLKDNEGMSSVVGVHADLGPIYSDCRAALEAGRIYAPWTATWTYGNPIVETYGKALQDVLAGQKTVKEALEEADALNKKLHQTFR
jgi:raffinose/stachyose/melibiose transport system substrate-binding protein